MSLLEMRAAMAEAAAAPSPFPEGRFSGRGIVLCAGGARLFTCAWICIGILRQLGCTLPVEVWHLGPQEISGPMRGLLREFGADCVDALEVAKIHPVTKLGGWELKPYALLHSRFAEALLLDADNVPVRDPTFLFDHPAFRETGAMFWPDFIRIARGNPVWSVAGLEPHDSSSFESGQVLLDKARSWQALTLAHWMNQHSGFFYTLLHGDKDTFLIAWLRLGLPFHVVRHPAKQLDHTICQRGPDGPMLFQHRNGAKWALRGDNPRIEGFRLEQECFDLLARLHRLWDGIVFDPPPRGAAALALEAELSHVRRFRFSRVSSDERVVELLPENRISQPPDYVYWHVEEEALGELALVLTGHRQACRLQRDAGGTWHGTTTALSLPIELVAEDAPASGGPVPEADAVALLLDRVLDLYRALPADAETLRDLVGTVRTLALLDGEVRDRLGAVAADEGDPRQRLAALAVAGWPEGARRSAPEAVGIGHDWTSPVRSMAGYDGIA